MGLPRHGIARLGSHRLDEVACWRASACLGWLWSTTFGH